MLRPCWDCVPVMSKIFINKKIKKSPDTTQTCGQLCPRSVCDQHRHFGHFAVFVLPSAPSSLKIITICRKIVKENIDLLQRQGFQKTEKIKILVFKSYIGLSDANERWKLNVDLSFPL